MKLVAFSTASEQEGPRFLKALTLCLVYLPKSKAYFPAKSLPTSTHPMLYTSNKVSQMRSLFYTSDQKKKKKISHPKWGVTHTSRILLTFHPMPVYSLTANLFCAEVWLDWRNQMCENVNLISDLCNLVLPWKLYCLIRKEVNALLWIR